MKKFTKLWQLTLILLLSSSFALAQSVERKIELKEQLKPQTASEEAVVEQIWKSGLSVQDFYQQYSREKQKVEAGQEDAINVQDFSKQNSIEQQKNEAALHGYEFIPEEYLEESMNLQNSEIGLAPSTFVAQPSKVNIVTEGTQVWGIGFQGNGFSTWDVDVPGTISSINPGVTHNAFTGAFSNRSPLYMYIVDNDTDELKMIDRATGTVARVVGVVNLGGQQALAMAVDRATGIMYLMTGTSDLYTLDLTTATVTLVGSTGIASMVEIAIDNSGQMYGWSLGTGNSYSIDKATGVANVLGPLGYAAAFVQGGDCDPATDIIYLAAYDNVTAGEERILDKVTGGTTLVGAFQAGEEYCFYVIPKFDTRYCC